MKLDQIEPLEVVKNSGFKVFLIFSSFKVTVMQVSGFKQPRTCIDDIQTDIKCDPCLCDHKSVTAVCSCADCNEFLCDNCARAHRHSQATKIHKLLDRDEMPKEKFATEQEFCCKHPTKRIEYFCEKHDQLCCSVCVTLESAQCKVIYIDDIAAAFSSSQKYLDLLKQIKLLESKLKDTNKRTESKCEYVNNCFNRIISDIINFCQEIDAKLDIIEKSVKEKTLKIKTHDLKSIQ